MERGKGEEEVGLRTVYQVHDTARTRPAWERVMEEVWYTSGKSVSPMTLWTCNSGRYQCRGDLIRLCTLLTTCYILDNDGTAQEQFFVPKPRR